jgi:hypothetical protein
MIIFQFKDIEEEEGAAIFAALHFKFSKPLWVMTPFACTYFIVLLNKILFIAIFHLPFHNLHIK